MKTVYFLPTLTLSALILTACGGSSVNGGGARKSTITRHSNKALPDKDAVSLAYKAYTEGRFLCAQGQEGLCKDATPSITAPEVLATENDYRAYYQCMTSPTTNVGYPTKNLSEEMTPSYAAAAVSQLESCCHNGNGTSYGHPKEIPYELFEGMTVEGALLNSISYMYMLQFESGCEVNLPLDSSTLIFP